MSKTFEVESNPKKDQVLGSGVKKIAVEWPEVITGEMWVDWWDRYYEGLGDFEKGRRSPGAQMKAKFLASLPLVDACTYVDSKDQIHDVKQEGLKAPTVVCNYLAQISDRELFKELELPKI
jgi:hypothetical protein